MDDSLIVPVTSLVSNIYYSDTMGNPDSPQHFKWRGVGDTVNMTFRQLREMFEQYPSYKDWLCPVSDVLEPLGLTMEHYEQLRKKYAKMRHNRPDYRGYGIYTGKA